MSQVLNITGEQEFSQEVLQSETPVLVDFWAPWCGPCRMMAPVLDQLAQELGDKIKIAKVDVENPENQALAMHYRIQSIPNMKLFKNNEMIQDFIGLRAANDFKKELEQYL